MEPETKPSLSARISSWLHFLGQILDSFWFLVFSKPKTPSTTNKHKLPRRIRDRERQLNTRVTAPTSVKSHKMLLEIVGAISALLTIFGFLLNYAPKLSVDVSGSLRATDPMGTVFQLSNDGLFPVHTIVVGCGMDKVGSNRGGIRGINIIMSGQGALAPILSPGHKMTVPCAHAVALQNPPADTVAEMTITVDFRPDWLFWRKHIEFPMRAERRDNGEWIWKYIPQ